MECAAKKYGDCTTWGVKEVDVLFLHRDKYNLHKPDRIVQVCMCSAHRTVLEKIHEGGPLEMRGENVEWALDDDLFIPFGNKENTYTYLKISKTYKDCSEEPYHEYCLVKGMIHSRNIEKLSALMYAGDPNISYISEEAIFLVYYKRIGAGGDYDVAEMKHVTGEYDMDVLKNLPTYYEPAQISTIHMGPGWYSVEPRIESNPTMETEYTVERAVPCIQYYFAKKLDEQFRAGFEECLDFMDNIDHTLLNVKKLRETSLYSQKELLGIVVRLTDALCVNDRECIAEMKESGEITEEVLWVTYVLANHELYWSRIPGRDLRKNIPLIKLFIEAGIHHNLLLLAVSGERERCLDNHQRTHHDILHENVYVVRYLVPKYFRPSMVVDTDQQGLRYKSSYKYYTEFSNDMYNCNPFSGKEEPFEKNKDILLHLLKCIVEENNAFLEQTGFEERLDHKERRLEYEALSEKIKEENEKWGSVKYYEKEELEWKTALENEGE
jgi:hypothetical protein